MSHVIHQTEYEDGPRVMRLIKIIALAASLGGCAWFGGGGKAKAPAVTVGAQSFPGAPGVPTRIVTEVPGLRMRVYQITLPLGAFSLNDKVWRQLDEDALDSATSVLLARNGLRAAVGPQERWPVIAKMLEGPGATSQEYLCQTDGRTSVQIPTRLNVPEQTVFYVDRDLEMQGRTFERCDNVVRLSMSKVRDSTDMLVQLEPVVKIGTMEVVRGPQEMGVVRTTIPEEETFQHLRLATRVPGNMFLVMAPSNPKGNPFSVGTRFLSDSDKVPPLETVLVFVPLNGVKAGR